MEQLQHDEKQEHEAEAADPGADRSDPPGGPTSPPIDAVGAGDTPPDPGD